MILREVTDFFRDTPPFSILSSEQMVKAAQNVNVEFYPKGHELDSALESLNSGLRIIRKGGVKISHAGAEGKDQVIDLRGKGETFGFFSMVTGEGLRWKIVAVEDSICYHVPRNIILDLVNEQPLLREFFLKTFFLNIYHSPLHEMPAARKLFGEGDSDRLLYLSRIGDLIRREPVTSGAGISIREASTIMSKNNISSLIFTDPAEVPLGIITLRDLRDKVLSQGMDPEMPAVEILSPATHTVSEETPTFEALLMMISHNIHHLIIVDDRQRLKGVLTNTDFMILQGISPVSIVKSIENQENMQGLAPLYGRTEKIITTLINDGVSARHITRIIANMNGRFARKTISFILHDRERDYFNSLSYFAFGSSGRSEQTFMKAWSSAIVYEMPLSGGDEKKIIGFCKKFMQDLNDISMKHGFPGIESGSFGGSFPSSGSMPVWESFIRKSLESDNRDLIAATCSFLDSRNIYGSDAVLSSLRKNLYNMISRDSEKMRALALPAVVRIAPLGFFNECMVNSEGTCIRELDIGSTGIYPIADCVRIMALFHHIDAVSTIERLYNLAEKEPIFMEYKNDLLSAFEFLLNLKIRSQLRCRETNTLCSNRIDPELMTQAEKRSMKEVFQIIARLQLAVENCLKKEGIL